MGTKGPVQITWEEEVRTLTLEGEPVLAYRLSWPRVEGAGLGGRWISRFYVRQAASWRRRWQQKVYWDACLELVGRRQASRPFSPWRGELSGEVTLCRDGLLSLRFVGEEVRGDSGRPNRVRWGDIWRVREGAPCPLGALFEKKRGWKRRLWDQVIRQGEERRTSRECFLDPDWPGRAKEAKPLSGCCLTEDGLELSLPQCAAAPAAEGCPVFQIPVP